MLSYRFNGLKSLCGAADQEKVADTTGSKAPDHSPAPLQAQIRYCPLGAGAPIPSLRSPSSTPGRAGTRRAASAPRELPRGGAGGGCAGEEGAEAPRARRDNVRHPGSNPGKAAEERTHIDNNREWRTQEGKQPRNPSPRREHCLLRASCRDFAIVSPPSTRLPEQQLSATTQLFPAPRGWSSAELGGNRTGSMAQGRKVPINRQLGLLETAEMPAKGFEPRVCQAAAHSARTACLSLGSTA